MTALMVILSVLAWNEAEVGDRLALTQSLLLGSTKIGEGAVLRLEEFEPLAVPGAPLVHYVLTEEKCDHPDASSDIEIVTPAGNPESTAAGVQLSPGCHWEIYLEEKDLFTSSFFSRVP